MQLHYSIRRDEYVRAIEASVGTLLKSDAHAGFERRRKILTHVRDGLCLLALVTVIWADRYAARALLIFAAIAVIVWTIAEWAIARTPTAVGTTFHPRRHEELSAEFGQDEITLPGAEHHHGWRRSMLQRVHELADVYVLEFAGHDILVVPKRAFTSPQDEARWAEDIRRHLPSA
jgi:hypothetical protein